MSGSSFRVPFPAAGEGLFLYFNMADIETLETTHGAGEVLSGAETFLLEKTSATHIHEFLKIGLKYDDGSGKALSAWPDRVEGAPDSVPFPMVAAVMPVVDAVCLSIYSKKHEVLVQDAIERQKAMQAEIEAQQKASDQDPFPASEE